MIASVQVYSLAIAAAIDVDFMFCLDTALSRYVWKSNRRGRKTHTSSSIALQNVQCPTSQLFGAENAIAERSILLCDLGLLAPKVWLLSRDHLSLFMTPRFKHGSAFQEIDNGRLMRPSRAALEV
jgi:hypothetical protein